LETLNTHRFDFSSRSPSNTNRIFYEAIVLDKV
jgi:hypothetical protein